MGGKKPPTSKTLVKQKVNLRTTGDVDVHYLATMFFFVIFWEGFQGMRTGGQCGWLQRNIRNPHLSPISIVVLTISMISGYSFRRIQALACYILLAYNSYTCHFHIKTHGQLSSEQKNSSLLFIGDLDYPFYIEIIPSHYNWSWNLNQPAFHALCQLLTFEFGGCHFGQKTSRPPWVERSKNLEGGHKVTSYK